MALKLGLKTVLVWASVVLCWYTVGVNCVQNWLPRYISVLSDVEVGAGPPSAHSMHHSTTTYKTCSTNCSPFSCLRTLTSYQARLSDQPNLRVFSHVVYTYLGAILSFLINSILIEMKHMLPWRWMPETIYNLPLWVVNGLMHSLKCLHPLNVQVDFKHKTSRVQFSLQW